MHTQEVAYEKIPMTQEDRDYFKSGVRTLCGIEVIQAKNIINDPGFKAAYTAEDRKSISDERWSCYIYDQISEEGKNHSLDLGLIKDASELDYDDLPDPIESGEECIAQLEEAVDLLMSVVKELKSLEGAE